jgi:beta-mannanase
MNCKKMMNGTQDAYMTKFAAAAKAYGGPIILSPLHEMNGSWSIWDGQHNAIADVVKAFQYTAKFFKGITNVKIAWVVNNDSDPDTTANKLTNYYPGSEYVDIVGVDGFNFSKDGWNAVFPKTLFDTLKAYGKPIYITSTASAVYAGKTQWIKDLGGGVKTYGVSGWVWFNINKEANWLVNSDANSLTAFKSILA